MEQGASNADWVERFQGLRRLSPEIRDELTGRGAVVKVPAGQVIFGPGQPPEHFLLLLAGRVLVHQVSENGHDIVLYRVDAGQSCVMTTACLLAHEDYLAEGVAETEVEAVALPRTVFDHLMSASAEFRTFVFTAYSKRITDLMRVIDEVAFGRIDVRLAQRLTSLVGENGEVRATHQQMATELGTAREVVSRQLQEFQRRGWIEQSRGVIRLADKAALTDLAAA